MKTEKKIEQLIDGKFRELSPGQRRVAEYLTDSPIEFCMSTVAQIAKKVNLSETTVIRLSYSLGFDSFSQMQRKLQKEFLETSGKENVSHEETAQEDPVDTMLEKIVQRETKIIQEMLKKMDKRAFHQAIDLLMTADFVKIGGFLASHSSASWFYLKMSMMRDNVMLLSREHHPFSSFIMENGRETVVFLVSMPSYATETLQIAQIAKEQGATLIVLTDRRLSPVGRLADICLTTDIEVYSKGMISIASVMTYLNLITAGIEVKYSEEVSQRLKNQMDFFSKQNLVIE